MLHVNDQLQCTINVEIFVVKAFSSTDSISIKCYIVSTFAYMCTHECVCVGGGECVCIQSKCGTGHKYRDKRPHVCSLHVTWHCLKTIHITKLNTSTTCDDNTDNASAT